MNNLPVSLQKVSYLTIDENNIGQRLDNFLIAQLKGVPKSKIYRILRKGEVRVNKKRVKPQYRLEEGDEVRIPPIRQGEERPVSQVPLGLANELQERILFEDEGLIVVNKPSGVAVHGGSGLSFGVIEAFRQMRPEQKFLELVHRLDRETSGVLLLAKKRKVLIDLHEQLRTDQVDKRYVALVAGKWRGGSQEVDAPLLKNVTQSGERVVRVSREGKPSLTRFKTLERFSMATLVEAKPVTGRTHQIRVHCQYVGCPIVGDEKYASNEINKTFKEFGVRRLFLHARSISFRLPGVSEPLTIEAELDPELALVLSNLRKMSK